MWYDSKHVEILDPKEWYNLIANEYKNYHNHLTSFDKWFFLSLLPRETASMDVIDLGAGDGRIYRILQAKNYAFNSYTACDISEKLLKQHPAILSSFNKGGDHRTEDLKKVICDVENTLPFEDQSFDLAFSFFVLEHIADVDHVFVEMERILRSWGKRIIGHFLQRREFIWKKGPNSFKIRLYNHRLQDIEKIGRKNLFDVTNYPIYEKWNLIWYIIVCEK